MQEKRYKRSDRYNGYLTSAQVKRYAMLSPEAISLLNDAAQRLGLTGRSYFKVIKVARTIADLDESTSIQTTHIGEALQYRAHPFT